MMRNAVILMSILCVTIALIHAAYIPTTIIATTYDLQSKNNSIILVDTSNGNLTQRQNFGNVFTFTSATIDVRKRNFYLLGDTIWKINADTFLPERVLPVGTLQHIQYDYSLGRMFGVKIGSESIKLIEVNMDSGAETDIVLLPIHDVIASGFAYDQKNHRYFITSSNEQKYFVLVVDTKAAKVLNQINLETVLENLVYDPIGDRLLGLDFSTLCSVEKIGANEQSQFTKLIKLTGGLPNLYGATVDPLNNWYIVNLILPQGSVWVSVDLVSNKIVYQQKFFANVHNVQLLPKSSL